jgi:hypothetical protein
MFSRLSLEGPSTLWAKERRGILAIVLLLGISGIAGITAAQTKYHVIKKFPIAGEGSWDYISIDPEARRLYVSHGTQLEVLDADSGKVVGQIPDTLGVHGAAIAADLHRGFTSNGREKSVTIFDTDSLKTIKKVPVNGTDFILYDPFSKRVFPLTEKVTVLDANSGDAVGQLDLGGDPEAAVSDGKGTVYVNLVDRKAVAVVDTKTLAVKGTYAIDHCTSPHSLSYDATNQRLFVGCREGFAALDATTGKVVDRSMICSGVDASGWDADNKLIFESCAEGVISIIRQVTPDYYELIETVPTQLFAKTMAFDPKTRNIYLPTADFEFIPDADPKKPPTRRSKTGSFQVLVVSRH